MSEGNPAFIADEGERAEALQRMFETGRGAETLEHLVQMAGAAAASSSSSSLRMLHNIALAEHAARAPAEPAPALRGLRAALATVRQRILSARREIASAAASEASSAPSLADAPPPEDAGDLDIVDYNDAVACVLGREYGAAQRLLEGVFHRIDAVDEWLSDRVCLLLASLYAAHGLHDAALAVAAHAVAALSASGRDNRRLATARLLRARSFAARGEGAAAREELKAAQNADATTAALAGALLACMRQDERKALRLLADASSTGLVPQPVLLADIGCVHARLRKPRLAALYYTRALQQAAQPQGPSVGMLGKDWTLQLAHDLGIQLLLAGRPAEACECLLSSAPLFASTDPLYWLRLAECTIANAAQADRAADSAVSPKHLGSGAARKLVYFPPPSHRKQQQPQTTSEPLTLAFGVQCCRNALRMLDARSKAASSQGIVLTLATAAMTGSASEPASTDAPDLHSSPPSPPDTPRPRPATLEADLRIAALVDLAWLSLAAGDAVSALAAAKEVLAGDIHGSARETARFLSNVYAAEALCSLDRASQAIQHLTPAALADAQHAAAALGASPYSAHDLTNSPSNAVKSALYVNLAVAHILHRDDVAQAQQCLQQAMSMHASPHALLLQAYIEIRAGNMESAVELLKRGRVLSRRASKAKRSDI